MTETEQKDLQTFIDTLRPGEPVSAQEFEDALRSAYKDRSTQIYFIWKTLKELYPDIDANKVIREASRKFGLWQGNSIVAKHGKDIGPRTAVTGQTSKGGWAVFQQEITEFNDNKAVKLFHRCPHAEAIKAQGESPEVIKMFCRDMMGECDYAIVDPMECCEIDFPTTVADGEGKPCAMTITRKKAKA